jgi:hypothetical protein
VPLAQGWQHHLHDVPRQDRESRVPQPPGRRHDLHDVPVNERPGHAHGREQRNVWALALRQDHGQGALAQRRESRRLADLPLD